MYDPQVYGAGEAIEKAAKRLSLSAYRHRLLRVSRSEALKAVTSALKAVFEEAELGDSEFYVHSRTGSGVASRVLILEPLSRQSSAVITAVSPSGNALAALVNEREVCRGLPACRYATIGVLPLIYYLGGRSPLRLDRLWKIVYCAPYSVLTGMLVEELEALRRASTGGACSAAEILESLGFWVEKRRDRIVAVKQVAVENLRDYEGEALVIAKDYAVASKYTVFTGVVEVCGSIVELSLRVTKPETSQGQVKICFKVGKRTLIEVGHASLEVAAEGFSLACHINPLEHDSFKLLGSANAISYLVSKSWIPPICQAGGGDAIIALLLSGSAMIKTSLAGITEEASIENSGLLYALIKPMNAAVAAIATPRGVEIVMRGDQLARGAATIKQELLP